MKRITEKLLEIGIRPDYAGFKYLEVAIKYYLDHSKEVVRTMAVYEYTAKKFNTKTSRVERAIRHAKDNSETKSHRIMTAGNFMARIATELKYEEI